MKYTATVELVFEVEFETEELLEKEEVQRIIEEAAYVGTLVEDPTVPKTTHPNITLGDSHVNAYNVEEVCE